VALAATLENFQNFQARNRGFQPGAFEFFDVGHGRALSEGQGYNGAIISLQAYP
jgi:hypothetical protein